MRKDGVLRHFQNYFSHIMATAHILMRFSGFHQCFVRSVLPKQLSRNSVDHEKEDFWKHCGKRMMDLNYEYALALIRCEMLPCNNGFKNYTRGIKGGPSDLGTKILQKY